MKRLWNPIVQCSAKNRRRISWSSADHRFGEDLQVVRVNTAQNWVVPKELGKKAISVAVLALVAVVFSTGCAGAFVNPFQLIGTEFLTLLIPALFLALLSGHWMRSKMYGPEPKPEELEVNLDWIQTAYLAGGTDRILTATIARLVGSGLARVSLDGKQLEAVLEMPQPMDLTAVERTVLRWLPLRRDDQEGRKQLHRHIETQLEVPETLAESGYFCSKGRQFLAAVVATLPVVLVLLFLALPRLSYGMIGHKPVGYLVGVIVASGMIALLLAIVTAKRLTRRGSAVLKRLQHQHQESPSMTDPALIGMSVALFGTAALANSALPDMVTLKDWYPRQTTVSNGGCGTGCGSGGGGCGGGGCGGGGCGGCGG
jgi:uncharacterized protein (TIGR04222 family)